MSNTRDENLGYLFGLVAVAAFSLTLPATRAAVRVLDPVFVGFGQAVGAALLSGCFLLVARQRLPSSYAQNWCTKWLKKAAYRNFSRLVFGEEFAG